MFFRVRLKTENNIWQLKSMLAGGKRGREVGVDVIGD